MSSARHAVRALALLLFFSAGCAIDASQSTSPRCTSDAECGFGHCYRGFCVSDRSDSGMDAGLPYDGGPDANVPMDTNVPDGSDGGLGGDANVPDCGVTPAACSTGLPGVCADGHLACSATGMQTCVSDVQPSSEVCGRPSGTDDEDCDGVIDEESNRQCYPGAMPGCTPQAGGGYLCVGLCQPGTQVCSGGALQTCAGQVPPATETCTAPGDTAFDEDCDGDIDEDCGCTGSETQPCFHGSEAQAGVGRCSNGTQTCTSGHWSLCTGDGAPMPETCMNAGQDDDCDSFVDDVPGRGVPCTRPFQGVCGSGTMQCDGAALGCVGPDPATAEACDHLDDDCDGAVDETFLFASDHDHCGNCETACTDAETCCNGHCVDPSSDEMHCGSCTDTCSAAGSQCCMDATSGAGMCLDTLEDPMNCGACGNVCNGGQLCCAGACIDPLADPMNCNGCGNVCNAGGATACCGGACHLPGDGECTGCGTVNCSMQTPPQECCGNSCADTMTDENNCGSCGTVCNAGDVCCGGHCVGSTTAHCGSACSVCDAGDLCCNGACVDSDPRHCVTCGMTCSGSSNTCCADGCRDITRDANDCGMCGRQCTGSTPTCSNSHCCPSGQTWCGGSTGCVNLNTSGSNCGSCGHGCVLGCNGSGSCNLL
ncbi:MAG: hypothetical protein U0234_20680 [Sandaracinus sp.]